MELIEPCVLAGCDIDSIVLNPFMGLGTTGIAALKHSRNFIEIELNPECK
nr:DNA methyltransferase [Bacillus sp. 28A-2]